MGIDTVLSVTSSPLTCMGVWIVTTIVPALLFLTTMNSRPVLSNECPSTMAASNVGLMLPASVMISRVVRAVRTM